MKLKRCQVCKAQSDAAAVSCAMCGEASWQSDAEALAMFPACSKCGARMIAGSLACPACGLAQSDAVDTTQPPAPVEEYVAPIAGTPAAEVASEKRRK